MEHGCVVLILVPAQPVIMPQHPQPDGGDESPGGLVNVDMQKRHAFIFILSSDAPEINKNLNL